MKDDPQAQLKAYGAKASEQDIPRIAQDLDGMNRGRIRKIWAEVQLLWTMVKDPQAAWSSKAIAIGALLYLVSPIDVIPDVVPVLGLTDDVGVILAAVGSLSYQLTKYRVRHLAGEASAVVPPTTKEGPIIDVEPVSQKQVLPPALPPPVSVEERLKRLSSLHRQQLITDDEYQAKRREILGSL